MVCIAGCDEEEKLVEMAEKHLASQAEQNRNVVELQREVAQGARELVEADSKSRQDIVTLHREVQEERAEFGKQRDALEEDRREIAQQRHWDSLTAAAITAGGFLICCALPLLLCFYLIRKPDEPVEDREVVDVLLYDLVSEKPLLLPRGEFSPAIDHHRAESHHMLPKESLDPVE